MLLLVHAAIFLVRIPLAGSLPLVMTSHEIHVDWWTFVIFEAVFFSVSMAYLLGGMTRERIVLWHKHASLIDSLTGVSNRRAFMERGEKLLHRAWFERRPAALLLLDLDKFKVINDTYDHHAGDQVLTAFCGVATDAIRPGDLFGRLGGEEFAWPRRTGAIASSMRARKPSSDSRAQRSRPPEHAACRLFAGRQCKGARLPPRPGIHQCDEITPSAAARCGYRVSATSNPADTASWHLRR